MRVRGSLASARVPIDLVANSALLGRAVLLFLCACGTQETTEIEAVDARSVTILTPSRTELGIGEELQLAAIVADQKGQGLSGWPLTWSSLDSLIAQVSSSGRVRAIAPGAVTIRAQATNGVRGDVSLSVKSPVASLTLSASGVVLQIGQSVAVTFEARDSTGALMAAAPSEWSSSDGAIASVSNSGAISALGVGTATVTLRVLGRTAQVYVAVPQEIAAHGAAVTSLAFSADRRYLVSGAADGIVRVWASPSWTLYRVIEPLAGGVRSVDISSDGAFVAAVMQDNTIRVWAVESGALAFSKPGVGGSLRGVSISPDGAIVAAGLSNWFAASSIALWRMSDGEAINTFVAHGDIITGVQFMPDGQSIASGAHLDFSVRIWNAQSGTRLRTLVLPQRDVVDFAVSAAGNRLVTSARRGYTPAESEVRFHEVGAGVSSRVLATGGVPFFRSVAISPTGRTVIALLSSGRFYAWDALGDWQWSVPITGVETAFGRDGMWVAIGQESGKIVMLRVAGWP